MERQPNPVDVICLCSACGEIRPLRLRIEDPEQRLRRLDICEVVSVRKASYVGAESMVFLCRAAEEGAVCLVELRYILRNHSWQLIRMVN